jgi:mannosyltransferase
MPYSKTTKTALTLVGLMAIPVVLSALFFMGQSLRLDESQSLWQTSRSAHDIFTLVAGDVHVPLFHILLHFWQVLVGSGVVYARAMSLLFYCLSIPALYFLGARAFTPRIGLYAAFLFAISPFMNWYGNEIRMYTVFTFLVILNQYFYIRIWKSASDTSEGAERTREHMWVGYILTAVFGVFSHYFFFLNLLAQALFYFLRSDLFPARSIRRFFFAGVVVCAAFVPWVWYVMHLGTAGFQEPALAVPGSVNLFNTFSQFLFGFQNDNINTFFLSLWPLTVILAVFALRRKRQFRPETEYFLLTLLLSLATAFVVSFIIAPVFVSRYLIFTIPSFYLLLASLFDSYSPRFAKSMRIGLATVMVLTLIFEVWNPTTPVKENYSGAVAYLNEHTTPQDTILISAPFTVYPVQYYYRGTSPVITIPLWNQYEYGPIPAFNKNELPKDVHTAVGSSQNVYLLLSYNQGYEKDIKGYFDNNYQLLEQQNFSQGLNLYVYKLRYDTAKTAMGGLR